MLLGLKQPDDLTKNAVGYTSDSVFHGNIEGKVAVLERSVAIYYVECSSRQEASIAPSNFILQATKITNKEMHI